MSNFELTDTTKLFLQIALLLLIGLITSRYTRKIIERVFNLRRTASEIATESEQIKITVLKHSISVIQYVIWIVVLLSIGSLLQMSAFVQILTALGVIVGYVARDFVNDFIMGLLVLTEQQFRVGDTVTINDKKGTVLIIGIRTTTIHLETGERFIISNRLITSVVVHPIELPMKKRRSSQGKGASKKDAKK